jgi:hypothetical protein
MPRAPPPRQQDPAAQDVNVQDRLQQLENLVVAMMQQNSTERSRQDSLGPSSSSDLLRSSGVSASGGSPPGLSDFGGLKLSHSDSTYVETSHWTSILDGITELKDHFEAEDELPILRNSLSASQSSTPGIMLFNGCRPVSSTDELLAAIPPRETADQLVLQYFQALNLESGKPSRHLLPNPCEAYKPKIRNSHRT